MKKSRGFTLVEIVVVLAVSSVLFAVIAALSTLTSNFVRTSRGKDSELSAFNSCKESLTTIFSAYSADYFAAGVSADGSEVQIYQQSGSDREVVATVKYASGKLNLTRTEIVETEPITTTEQKDIKAESVSFRADGELKLIIVEFDFGELVRKVVINVAGMAQLTQAS